MVQRYIDDLHSCLRELPQQNIEEIAEIIFNAYKKGKQVFIMGNGGSATSASHFARDLQMGTAVDGKPRVQASSLTDNPSIITAIANDTDYSNIFKEQLAGQLNEGNVVIAFSAIGKFTQHSESSRIRKG